MLGSMELLYLFYTISIGRHELPRYLQTRYARVPRLFRFTTGFSEHATVRPWSHCSLCGLLRSAMTYFTATLPRTCSKQEKIAFTISVSRIHRNDLSQLE